MDRLVAELMLAVLLLVNNITILAGVVKIFS